ncbi:hypothetical protein PACTADRAFT_73591 [Pachysolen tannophilus NRRL Y-2460]|uniref:Kynureninase n=1 Tax=Pachysolen tannophilus NRRL Y-2460 TaxID=669874 RepID=A0A1E4U1Q2_PACTA|nr:hypothetical protein PACTADRAFT_73591 [Pachysolen tannophilus NRRL Y-2460]
MAEKITSLFHNKAVELDAEFGTYKDEFNIPTLESLDIRPSSLSALPFPRSGAHSSIYLCGNSLGLMPKSVRAAINDELDAWSARGVESHFRHPGNNKTPWVDIDLPVVPLLSPIVGAKEKEVAAMGTLTMDLNALLCCFYKPNKVTGKTKILFEKSAFPSDYYAFYNQVKLHNLDPAEELIQIAPREGEYTIRTEDILMKINDLQNELALVCFPGIQYYTGQFFEIAKITEFAHSKGIIVGWDLAHCVGNVELKLHDWKVDFAAWCSYKYLNSGPGAIGGIFVHEKWSSVTDVSADTSTLTKERDIPRLAGWWGNNSSERFKMLEKFDPIEGALGFRQSNPSVIDVVALKASLQIFAKYGGVEKLRQKSIALTNFMEELLQKSPYYISVENSFKNSSQRPGFTIITPSKQDQRGCQLSLLFFPHYDDPHKNIMEKMATYLNKENGIICDERRPDVIRIAPVPLYNTFQEVLFAVDTLNKGFTLIENSSI